MLLKSLPGMEGGNRGKRINIARIFDQQYTNVLQSIYNKVDVENTQGADEPTDELGFVGLTSWYRGGKQMIRPISEEKFMQVIA